LLIGSRSSHAFLEKAFLTLARVNSFSRASALRRGFPNRSYGELVTSWLVSLWRLEGRCVGLNSGYRPCSLWEFFKSSHSPPLWSAIRSFKAVVVPFSWKRLIREVSDFQVDARRPLTRTWPTEQHQAMNYFQKSEEHPSLMIHVPELQGMHMFSSFLDELICVLVCRLAAASCRQHQPLDCCLFAVCLVLIQSKWFSAEVGIVPMPRRTTKLGLTDQETGKACCNPISSENMSSVGFRIVHLSSHKFIASLGCTDSGESAQQVSEQLRNRRIWVWNKHKSTKGSNIRTAVNRQRKTRVSYRKTEPDLE